MCRGRLAFGGTHPAGISGVRATEYKFPFRSSCLTLCAVRYLDLAARTPPAFQESELPNPSFLFGVRAAGRRFPCPGGTSFRDTAPGGRQCRGTQVSQGRLLSWGTTGIDPNKSLNELPLTETLFKDVPLSSEHTTHIKYIGHPEQRALRAKDEKNTWVTTDY